MIDYILNPQSVEALGWTLLHSLWQGAAFAILLVLIMIALKRYSAQSRYLVSVGLLFAFFMTVTGTFWQQYNEASNRMELSALMQSTDNDEAILSNENSSQVAPILYDKGITDTSINENIAANQPVWLDSFKEYYQTHLPLLVTLWFLGILFLQLRFLGQLAYVQRLKHYGTELIPSEWKERIEVLEEKLRIQKKVSYLTSLRAETPMVIGWLKPVVLLPRQLLESLSETEIYAVLAHELAHIRREDFIVNIIQTFLCNVFFFHPGVWWMSGRIDEEREHCCDDLAIAATGQASSYAKTLINVSALQIQIQKNPQLAMAFSGKNKKRERGGFSFRIKRLFQGGKAAGSFREGFATACILVSALCLGISATEQTTQTKQFSETSETIEASEISEAPKSKEKLSKSEFKETSEIQSEQTVTDSQQKEIIGGSQNNENTPEKSPSTITVEVKSYYDNEQENFQSNFPIAEPATPEPPVDITSVNVSSLPTNKLTNQNTIDTRIDALVMACAEGDLEFVKTLVAAGIDVNGIGSEGFSPLMMATGEDDYKIVDYLIQSGAEVNQSINGWTALMVAADEGSINSMKYLLKAGADVNYYWQEGGPTAITMAASEDNLDCLKLLLENGADINGIGKSLPPLCIASEEGNAQIVDYLILQNVELDKKDSFGSTALMHAASEGQKKIVEKLLKAGADKSIVDANGYSASDYAEDENQYQLQKYLNTEERPAIHQATIDGLIENVERMVAQGVDINTKDDYGRTVLHLAAAVNHTIDMRVLLNLGVDIDAKDQQSRTALMYAAAAGHRDAAVLLVSERANVQIEDADGMRAYEWAQSGGNYNLTNFLRLITDKKENSWKSKEKKNSFKDDYKEEFKQLEKDLQKDNEARELLHISGNSRHLTQYDMGEEPALLTAVKNRSKKDCIRLLDSGANVNASDNTGQTALMIATSQGDLGLSKILIDYGASVNMSSISGLTALHYAAFENQTELLKMLLDNGAYIDATMQYSSTDGNNSDKPIVWEYKGATPLFVAVESGNTNVISILLQRGANQNHILTRNEYLLDKDHSSYLTGGEVMGHNIDFLNNAKVQASDNKWTPQKQAVQSDNPAIISLFKK